MDNRRKDGKFGPGNKANPSGRPKVAEEFRAKARKAVDDHVLAAWINEVEALGDNWVKCSELLAAYGYGRPAQAITGADGGPLELMHKVRAEDCTDNELAAIVKGAK